jgi:hypothetical protein
MHQALLLPEIIANILQTEGSSPGFLHTCLLINRIFFVEASRILWEGCGSRYYSAWAGHITPDIKHLANIVLTDPRRAQFYANLIHTLMFQDEGESNNFLDDARLHKELASLEFPQLEEVAFYGSDKARELNTGDAIIHYAQPNIKNFSLGQGSNLSDTFLDTLSRCCPKLTSLTLNRVSESNVSEDGLIRFLEKNDLLDYLDIRSGVDDSWSCKAFNVITRYRNLVLLRIPDLQDNWAQSLQHGRPSARVFPKLKHLHGGISDQGLKSLAQFLPDLESLGMGLQNLLPSHHILASASQFSQLTRLTIYFGPESSFSGRDLLLLTQKCPNLGEVSIGENDGYRPTSSDITDSIIDEVARNMVKLTALTLVFDRPDLLTWKSIISLAQHCKDLQMLKLSCNFSWQDAISNGEESIFPILWGLQVILDENNRDGQMEINSEEEINNYVARFAALAPNLKDFGIEDGSEADQTLEVAIWTFCSDHH